MIVVSGYRFLMYYTVLFVSRGRRKDFALCDVDA